MKSFRALDHKGVDSHEGQEDWNWKNRFEIHCEGKTGGRPGTKKLEIKEKEKRKVT